MVAIKKNFPSKKWKKIGIISTFIKIKFKSMLNNRKEDLIVWIISGILALLLIGFTGRETLAVFQAYSKQPELLNEIEKLKRERDSLDAENFMLEINLSRFEYSLEQLRTEDSVSWESIMRIYSNETE
jgi:hypothetical protein